MIEGPSSMHLLNTMILLQRFFVLYVPRRSAVACSSQAAASSLADNLSRIDRLCLLNDFKVAWNHYSRSETCDGIFYLPRSEEYLCDPEILRNLSCTPFLLMP
jgi:hypothetical protein